MISYYKVTMMESYNMIIVWCGVDGHVKRETNLYYLVVSQQVRVG